MRGLALVSAALPAVAAFALLPPASLPPPSRRWRGGAAAPLSAAAPPPPPPVTTTAAGSAPPTGTAVGTAVPDAISKEHPLHVIVAGAGVGACGSPWIDRKSVV